VRLSEFLSEWRFLDEIRDDLLAGRLRLNNPR